jgi:hypothetical protein
MPISFQTYRTIKRTLAHALHARRGSHHEQHINTLALLICGIVGAGHVQFAQIAEHVPIRGRKNESLITRFRRFVTHEAITPDVLWLPFARAVVDSLAHSPLTIVLDATTAGRGCVVLMASVLYQGRAIPLLWTVVKGKKGHLPQALHCGLIERVQAVIPSTATVVVLGDGEFDGVELQATIRAARWDYVCRTGSNITIYAHDQVFTVGDLPIARGKSVAIADVEMTLARYGPVLLMGVWDDEQDAPIYLISSLTDADAAAGYYRKRFRIECLFANHKSRGFQIQKSHLSDPARLARLLIATSLAYLWVMAVAMFAQEQDWVSQFHRSDRCDLSLFQIGLRALRYAQREGKRIPVSFRLPDNPSANLQEANEFSVR